MFASQLFADSEYEKSKRKRRSARYATKQRSLSPLSKRMAASMANESQAPVSAPAGVVAAALFPSYNQQAPPAAATATTATTNDAEYEAQVRNRRPTDRRQTFCMSSHSFVVVMCVF